MRNRMMSASALLAFAAMTSAMSGLPDIPAQRLPRARRARHQPAPMPQERRDEIAAHNAAIEAKKAAKRARKMANATSPTDQQENERG